MTAEVRNRILDAIRLSDEVPTKYSLAFTLTDIKTETVLREINAMLDEHILTSVDRERGIITGLRIRRLEE